MKSGTIKLFLPIILFLSLTSLLRGQKIPPDFIDPPREFSVMPFWFWNDTLKDEEIIRQIADFEANGVYGFVIHPRIGLPGTIGWLSPAMIHFMHVAIREAARRKMYVILYDEGMYPSGSSGGQVVARNPEHAARGLAKIDLKPGEEPQLAEGMKLINIIERPGGQRVAVIDQPSGGVIRGIHYVGEGTTEKLREHLPPAGDILNPDAVTSFIELVYERYAEEFGKWFGTTVIGIFTDEPDPLGRSSARGVVPGNASLIPQINSILGYDITPFLGDLWYNDHPESLKRRADYRRAINICLEENYYRRLGEWCDRHGIALMGHPAGSMDIGTQRYFQIPGQDLVWRYVEPGPKALEGQHSTMAKCASSAMIHLGRRRNSNELYGAYGHNLTYGEMVWLAYWCFVRGHNLLIPHAFYYSIRGPRFDERPPDVGPNSVWWDNYKPFADACRRLSWINTDSRHVCEVAILAEATYLPDKTAKICYQSQRDFNYLELRHLWEEARVDAEGVHIAGMLYRAVILDSLTYLPPEAKPMLAQLAENGRLIVWKNYHRAELPSGARVVNSPEELKMETDSLITPSLFLSPPSENIRYRHVIKDGDHYFLLFNEDGEPVSTKVDFTVKGTQQWLDPNTGNSVPSSAGEVISFRPHELKLLRIITSAN
ncbi:MAG: glycosyl hydrolase [Bacteroidales bacterium]